jgi:EmrB/QacA subfamily drug resistance transporter
MYMKKESSNVNMVIAGLLLGIIISAMDNTIVSTAMGTIISKLGGMDKFIWVSSAYLIASVAGMPIYGKLSDMYGRKVFFIAGLFLFITGSALCGLSQSMEQLIIFRAIQGLGGGAIIPIAFTIIFDIIPIAQRGKFSGLFGAAFGVSSVFGPLIGSFFAEYTDWRWIFYINIPLGILSIFFLYRFYSESLNHKKQKIDWLGAGLLVLSVVSLMFALEMGGKNYEWASIQIIALFSLFAAGMCAFLFVESKVPEPIVPIDLFKARLFACSQITAFLYGTVFIIAIVFIPIFVQGVFGGTATNSGLILMPMMLASVVGSQIGGLLTIRLSYRKIMIGSIAFLFLGFILLGTLTVDSTRLLVIIFMIITGAGVGVSFSVLTISSTDGILFNRMGSANSSLTFFRSVGMTLGLTIFGTIQNNIMQGRFIKDIPSFINFSTKLDARALLQPQVRIHIPAEVLVKMTGILAGSITQIFVWSLAPLTIALFFIMIMGSKKMMKNNDFKEGVLPDVNEDGGTRNLNGGEQSPL